MSLSLFISSPEHFLDLNNARQNMDGISDSEQRGGDVGLLINHSPWARVGAKGNRRSTEDKINEPSDGKG